MRQRIMSVEQIAKMYKELEERVQVTKKALSEAEVALGFDSLAHELIKGAHTVAVEELENFGKAAFREV